MANNPANPFAALFSNSSSKPDDERRDKEMEGNTKQETEGADARNRLRVSYCIERNVDNGNELRPQKCVFLKELYSSLKEQEWLDMDIVSQAMFERSLMGRDEVLSSVCDVNKQSRHSSSGVSEPRVIVYLYQCFLRASKQTMKDETKAMKKMIVECATTCLRQPDLYEGQKISNQLRDVFTSEYFTADGSLMQEFMELVLNELNSAESYEAFFNIISPLLVWIYNVIKQGMAEKLCASSDASQSMKMIDFFTRNELLAKALLIFNVSTKVSGDYENSLFGLMLSSSCVPKTYGPADDLFATPSRMSQADIQRADSIVNVNTELVVSGVHDIFMKLCRVSATIRQDLLDWLGLVLKANYGRVTLASTMSLTSQVTQANCSDGFMLNLSAVLLKMCQPFSEPCNVKLLKIQPYYCRDDVSIDEKRSKDLYCEGLTEQTFLIPLEQSDLEATSKPQQYGFITNLFFLTHLSLYLGLHSFYEKFIELNRQLNRLQEMYQQGEQAAGTNFPIVKSMFENAMKKFLVMRTAMTDPILLKPVLRFHIATATYLTYLATGGDNSKPFSSIKFPLDECNKEALGCVPEFVITNVMDALVIARRFKEVYVQEVVEFSGHVMNLILVFMGSKERVKNPHLRAKLAEVLHELMPRQKDTNMALQMDELVKERLFTHHENIDHLSEVLFHVFVSIESTGESVQFEQKLSYRQPMYKIIDFIWKFDIHKESIVRLCEGAMRDLDNTDPPLFLRFVNLLVNDANFLLDEALDYMKQIKEKEVERSNRVSTLQAPEQQQYESDLAHLTMLSRFHNAAAVDTSHTLSLLTSNCSQLFCHDIMIDRIAAMLNYFLLKLTGPQMGEFKVSDFDRYEFKPSIVVSKICRIYVNLGQSDEFCQAVSADGRSFSPHLFPRAEHVLRKIHEPIEMIEAFNSVAEKVQQAFTQVEAEDAAMASAPDEYMDPLTGNIMKEPVILPSSRVTMDKSTIARHLLSDQSDPYNRSPLSLDQVIPDLELKENIQIWLKANIKKRDNSDKS